MTRWYFTLEKSKNNLKGIFGKAVKCTFKALGTIFVTSFITSLVVFIRMLFEYIIKRVE